MPWFQYQSVHYFQPSNARPQKVCGLAGFDLDSTLILSNRGQAYPREVKDWVWAYPGVVSYLTQLQVLGWTVVVFSNRRGSPTDLRLAKQRIQYLFSQLGFEFWVWFATRVDNYRKPNTGMVELFAQLLGIEKWIANSFYCGDAAGPTSENPRHRWSDVDVKLAAALGLTFYEPQTLFGEFPMTEDLKPLDVKAALKQVKLVITCGQLESGWEEFLPYMGQIVSGPGCPSFYIAKDLKDSGPGDLAGLKVVVCGSHPTRAERDRVRLAQSCRLEESIVFWYACPSISRVNSNYELNFEMPSAEPYLRIN